ncbi:ORF 3b [Casuarina virus]|uniref:ORF 3b n=1 Tax=Casuarina virus TaxID=1482319 RepID=X4YJY8_9NIDO|nr:ORF 3b [Casuarina virus]AHV78365.1 ORF 3b [Casuarina virus]QVU02393.1 protein 3b [Alphamesonivirus sp.]QVU02399.1 protein 3b [Alphamesonivirus sp.]
MLKSMLCIRTQTPNLSHCTTSPYYHEGLTAAIRSCPQADTSKLTSRIASDNRVRWLADKLSTTITYSYKLATFLYYIFTILYYGFCLIMLYILWVYFSNLTNQIKLIYHHISDPY